MIGSKEAASFDAVLYRNPSNLDVDLSSPGSDELLDKVRSGYNVALERLGVTEIEV